MSSGHNSLSMHSVQTPSGRTGRHRLGGLRHIAGRRGGNRPARTENQTRPISVQTKEALNALIDSYNVARTAWLTYRGAVATNTPSDQYFQQLTRNLTDLTNALDALKRRR